MVIRAKEKEVWTITSIHNHALYKTPHWRPRIDEKTLPFLSRWFD